VQKVALFVVERYDKRAESLNSVAGALHGERGRGEIAVAVPQLGDIGSARRASGHQVARPEDKCWHVVLGGAKAP
jgi:hypothetical protein